MAEQTSYSSLWWDFIKNRPSIPVLIICIFEFIGLLLLPFAFTNEKTIALGIDYQFYIALSGVLTVMIIYTLWKMKKLGIVIYIGAYTIHNLVAIIVGTWMMGVIIIPCIGLILIGLSYKKFS